MTETLLIALLNPAISAIFAGAFLLLWRHQPANRYLATFAFAYAVNALAFTLQYAVLPFGLEATRLASNALFMTGATTLAGSIVSRYGRPAPVAALAILAVGGVAAFTWFLFVEPSLSWRILSMNFALGGVALLVFAELRAVENKRPMDRLLMGIVLLIAANFLIRATTVVAIDGPHLTYAEFRTSAYWLTMVGSHALISTLCAVTLILVMTFDAFAEVQRESQTDMLSGLSNRRGFEMQSAAVLASANPGVPISLIVADLDRFKSVNDRFGHAAGDAVIAGFGQMIAASTGENVVAGRLGGEEFAILLPACDINGGRLLAETLRVATRQSRFECARGAVELTASFGVAVRQPDETLSDLLTRADAALYAAKASGRDCVRVDGTIERRLYRDARSDAAATEAPAVVRR